jgi:RecB family exonuclease
VAIRVTPPPRLDGPISVVSPSLAAQIELCPLAAVFADDGGFRALSRRWTHFAALGEICHTLWERQGRGDFDQVPETELNKALNAAWDEAEADATSRLQESLDGATPPPSNRWPDYMVKRLGALTLIKKSIRRRQETRRDLTQDVSRGMADPLVEHSLEAAAARLRGRPDRVIWADGAPHIIDLKTCPAGEEMRTEHRRQLLAYAYLFHAEHGVWPATATIQYVNGERRTFPVSPIDAEQVAHEMAHTLERVNEATDDILSLATPSPEACRWCAFKPACEPFFDAIDEDWGFPERVVFGTVESLETVAERASATITLRHGNIPAPTVVALADTPAPFDGVAIGDTIAIAGAKPTRSPTTIHCGWDAVVCVWAEAAT